ncbi:MAG: serine--tRNA ligase, partial [Pyrinomonadaceae bacterium]
MSLKEVAMLDLHFVRNNSDLIRSALQKRHASATALNDFTRIDSDRRRLISDSDSLNARRNLASREIGELMKNGKREEAEARRDEVLRLKEQIATLDKTLKIAETEMHQFLSTLPNVPHESVPEGADES